MDYFSVSWNKLHKDTHTLAKSISASGNKIDLIVAIARGGFTIAHMLSDFLKLPAASFTISSYKDMKRGELTDISFHVGGDLKNKTVLLVDDISDTGKTFIRGISYLKELGAVSIITASPYIKPWTNHVPDYYVSQTKDWIVMPYEVRETIESVHKTQGDTDKAKTHLHKIGFSKQIIKHYLKG